MKPRPPSSRRPERRSGPPSAPAPRERGERFPLGAECLVQRPLALEAGKPLPPVEVRSPSRHPFVFRKRLGVYDRTAQPGDLVQLNTSDGLPHGFGLFNPRAELTVRQLTWGAQPPDLDWWENRLAAAVAFRREFLQLDSQTNAYRLVHAEADGLPGVVIDRFGDTLVVEAYSLGMYQRAEGLLELLTPLCETQHGLLRPAPMTREHEGFEGAAIGSEGLSERVTIQEFGTKFRVEFTGGHKTGFYCDQRDNRRRLANLCGGKSVLDICCYTGGFAIQAKVLGKAHDVTGVELDEAAAALARDNAKLNKVPVQVVQADAFAYVRDMLRNGKTYDVVTLDPPKLLKSAEDMVEGRGKYFDLNRLAMQVTAPGGILVTCSCSGRLETDEFTRIVMAAAANLGRSIKIFDRHGAAPDHPVAGNCPESEYLKTLWIKMD